MTIKDLNIGEQAIIVAITNENVSLLLNELGFMIGETIELTSVAPLGDPICIKNQETLLSLRVSEAKFIAIKPVA